MIHDRKNDGYASWIIFAANFVKNRRKNVLHSNKSRLFLRLISSVGK